MYIKFISLLIVLFALGISGCAEQADQIALPQRRPLGQKLTAFQAPAKPAETSDAPEIAEPTGDVTLQQCLALALMHNPQLKAYSWEVRASQARRLQASLGPNPQLDIKVEEAGGTGGRSDFDGAETTIQLSQLIELGDKRGKRTKLASLDRKLAGWDYEAKRLDVFTDVARAFVELLAAQEQLNLADELLNLSAELTETVAKRVDAGKDSPLEKTRAEVALSKMKIQHQQARQALDFTRKQLASTWAGENPAFEKAAGKLDSITEVPPIEELMELITQNPDIERWSVQIDRQRAALELERARAVSDITLSGGTRRFNETNDNAVVFGISFPLQTANKNQGRKLEATYNIARARAEQRAARTKIQMELAKAYQALFNAYTEAAELDSSVLQGTESVFEAVKTAYTYGKMDYLNVMDAQRTLFEAKAQYIDALAAYHIARADVERLTGCPIENKTISKSKD